MNSITSLLLSLRDHTIVDTLSNVEVQNRIKSLLNITSGGSGLINSVTDTADIDLTVGVSNNLSASFVSHNISQFTNNSGYVTPSSVAAFTNKSGNISQWTNDSGYITSASAGAMVLLSVATASTSATIDFTGLDNTYRAYKVIYYDVVPSTTTLMLFRVGTGATPTYQTGASDYAWVYGYSQAPNGGAPTEGVEGDNADSFIRIGLASTTNNKNSVGELTIANPSNSTLLKNIQYQFSYIANNVNIYDFTAVNGSGWYLSTTAVTAIRFYMASGTINSGVFALFGIL